MLEEKITDLEKKVDLILHYLHNDHGTGTKGLVADFAEHKQKMTEFIIAYETDQAVKKARVTILGAIGGSIIMFIKWIIEKLMEGHNN